MRLTSMEAEAASCAPSDLSFALTSSFAIRADVASEGSWLRTILLLGRAAVVTVDDFLAVGIADEDDTARFLLNTRW